MRMSIQASTVSLLALIWATGASAQGVDRAAAVEGETQAEEIIVTAERRDASVQDTPLALSVLDGDRLRQGGNQGLTELAQQVPSLSFAQSFGISQIFIRGVGNNFFSPGGDPGVATYADGVYLSDQEATAVAFLDLERIEVLRGPQGALYGRNATGGAVNLVSVAPTDDFEGRVGIQLGNFGRMQGDAVLSGPLAAGSLRALACNIASFPVSPAMNSPTRRARAGAAMPRTVLVGGSKSPCLSAPVAYC